MRRLSAILLWSVIAAAFIGPGTVTTAAAAGAGFGLALLWTLVFSTVACLVLQEASARLTLVSGRNLGQALRHRYPAGFTGTAVLLLVLGGIVLGCAAYEAGNILGGVAGAVLATGGVAKAPGPGFGRHSWASAVVQQTPSGCSPAEYRGGGDGGGVSLDRLAAAAGAR